MNDDVVQELVAPAQSDLQRGVQVGDATVAADKHTAQISGLMPRRMTRSWYTTGAEDALGSSIP